MTSIHPAFSAQVSQVSSANPAFGARAAIQQPATDTLTLSPRFAGKSKDGEDKNALPPQVVAGMERLGVDPQEFQSYLEAPEEQADELLKEILRKSPQYAEALGIDPKEENPHQVLINQAMRGEKINNPNVVMGLRSLGLDPKMLIVQEMAAAYQKKYGADATSEQVKRLSELLTGHIIPAIQVRLDDEKPVSLYAIQNLLAPPPPPTPFVDLQITRQGETSPTFIKPKLEMQKPPQISSLHKAINEARLLSLAILVSQALNVQMGEMPNPFARSVATANLINWATLKVLEQVNGEQEQDTIHAFVSAANVLGVPDGDDALVEALCQNTNPQVVRALNALIQPLLEQRRDLIVENVVIDGEPWPFVTGIKDASKVAR